MRGCAAQRAGDGELQDRVFIKERFAILLDGASAFAPVHVSPATFVDALGRELTPLLCLDRNLSIPRAVGEAIAIVSQQLDLRPDSTPSSTISIVRLVGAAVEVYLLGDSPVYTGLRGRVTRLYDNRLEVVTRSDEELYERRLREGSGFDAEHRRLLVAMQRNQRLRRNTANGYWIAADLPQAADHGISLSFHQEEVDWIVLASDGAATPISFLQCATWHQMSQMNGSELSSLLEELERWEVESDPLGKVLPRSKCSDDKSIISISNLQAEM